MTDDEEEDARRVDVQWANSVNGITSDQWEEVADILQGTMSLDVAPDAFMRLLRYITEAFEYSLDDDAAHAAAVAVTGMLNTSVDNSDTEPLLQDEARRWLLRLRPRYGRWLTQVHKTYSAPADWTMLSVDAARDLEGGDIGVNVVVRRNDGQEFRLQADPGSIMDLFMLGLRQLLFMPDVRAELDAGSVDELFEFGNLLRDSVSQTEGDSDSR